MLSLTPKDYNNIIDFYKFVNKDYTNYENVVLLSLATIFDMRLSAYVSYRVGVNGEINVEKTVSNTVRRELLTQYRNRYCRDDAIIKRFPVVCYNDSAKYYYTDGDLDREDFKNSEYGRLLRKNNITHEAVIGINGSAGSLIQVVKIFRTEESGDFTEHDRELFQYIGEAFNQSKVLYSQYVLQQRRVEAVSAYCDEQDFGFAVLDGKGRLIQLNSAFTKYTSRLSTGLTKREITQDIIRAITGGDSLLTENYYREETHVSGLCVTLQKKKVAMTHRTENLYFITLQDENDVPFSKPDTMRLASRYGLTRRETDVVRLMLKGCGNQDISKGLFIGISTVKSHISNIYDKLGVSSRSEMLRKLREEENLKK